MNDQKTLQRATSARPRRRPPPNYGARGVQFRLLVLVFLIMTVLVLMQEARNPKAWQWMWQFQPTSAPQAGATASPTAAQQDTASAALDTRPERRAVTDESTVEPTITAPAYRIDVEHLVEQPLDEALAKAQLDGWSAVLDQIGQPRRDLLRLGLWRSRHGQPWEAEEETHWQDLLVQLTQHWTDYTARAREASDVTQDQLAPAQRQLVVEVLDRLHVRWQQQLAALAAWGTRGALSDEQAATLTALQQVLDERAWRAVADNMVMRAVEQEAWMRGWELLETDAHRARTDAPSVTFVQLFSQPDAYRGRLVQVSGTARLGYYTASRERRFGIPGYYVLWLRGADESNAPLVIYLRALPHDFPTLVERVPGQEGTRLREEVTVTGVFFKRWLYASGEGGNLAPLILGQITHWSPPAPGPAAERTMRPSAMTILYTVLAVALVAVALAVVAYRSSRWTRRDLSAVARPPSALPPFDEQSVRGSVQEALGRLAQDGKKDA